MTAPRAGDEEQPIRDTLLNTSELIGCERAFIVPATSPPSMQKLPDARVLLPDARAFLSRRQRKREAMVKDNDISSSPHVRPAAEETADDPTLSLAAEEVSIKKETHEIGRVRVATRTYEREALIDEDLARERVEIESVPVGRQIDDVPEVRQQGDITIVPVVEEVLFIERRLMLKEEIHIRRVRTTEHHQDKVMLRHQEPVVSRSQYEPGEPAATSAVGPGRAKT